MVHGLGIDPYPLIVLLHSLNSELIAAIVYYLTHRLSPRLYHQDIRPSTRYSHTPCLLRRRVRYREQRMKRLL